MTEGNGVTIGTPDPVLTDEQKARGQALVIARDILAQKGGGPFSSVSLANASPYDVINVAEYILNGQGYLGDGDDKSVGETAESDWDNSDAPYPAHRGAILLDPSFPHGFVIHGELSHAGVSNFIESQREASDDPVDEASRHGGRVARVRAILGDHGVVARQADEVIATLDNSGLIR